MTPDAPIDSIPTGTANVTAYARCCDVAPTTPQQGVIIVVVGADGTVGATATTGADGKASVAVKAGDSVSAAYPEVGSQTAVTTIVGVKPGDDLTFGDGYYTPNAAAGVDGQLDVSWPAVANANYYQVYSPCRPYGWYVDAPGTSTAMPIYGYCQTATAPILFVAFDDNGEAMASAYLPAAPYTPGTLPEITWTAETNPRFALSITGLDAAITSAYLGAFGAFPQRYMTNERSVTIEGGAASVNVSQLASAPRTYGIAELYRSGAVGSQRYFKEGTTSASFTGAPLPWHYGVVVSPGDGHFVWLNSGGTYDAAVLTLSWNRYVSKATHYYTWKVIVPSGVNDVTFGAPPAALQPYLPTSTDNLNEDLNYIDLGSASSYDALRGTPEWQVSDPEGAVRAGDETSAAVSSYDGGEGFAFASRVSTLARTAVEHSLAR